MPRGQLVPRRVIGQRPGDAGGQPEPAQLVLLRQPLVPERAERDLQRRRRRDIALAGKEGEPVEQQIAGARGGLPVGGQNGRRDLAGIASAHQAARGKRRRERFEVGLARERRIQRLEPPGRLEQQGRSIASPRHREGDLRVQQLGTGLLERVQRPCLRDRQQPQRRVVRSGLVLALCGEERTLCPAPRIGREFDGALVKCRPRRDAAARARSSRRALQLGGDVLVEPGCRVRKVPGAAIRIDIGIGGLGERAVDALALLRRCRSLDGRTDKRMPEAHLSPEIDQSRAGERRGRVRPDAELRGRPPHQHRIPHRLGRRDEKQQSCRRGQRRQPLSESLLDPLRQRRVVGQPEPARELGRREATRQLEQSQRVAARLGHDPIAHALIERAGDHRREELVRIAVVQPAHGELRQPFKMPLVARVAQARRPSPPTPHRDGARRRPALCAEAASSHCASSTMQTSGRSSATTDSRLKAARPTRNRSGASPSRKPNAVPSASRCGPGRRPRRSRNGAHSCCNPAYASSISDSIPAARATVHPDACCIRYSSSALLPTPASPRSTSARLGPVRTLATSSSSAAHSLRRPSSRGPETGVDIATRRG